MRREDSLNLKKRYLLWLYKTTKEELDRTERKFTQLEIDGIILKELKKLDKKNKAKKLIADFAAYMENKQRDAAQLKYEGKNLKPDYYALALKLAAIENAIIEVFGSQGLKEIRSLYEKEMTERILKSTEKR